MDNRLKFLYCRWAYEGSGDAAGYSDRAAGRSGQGCKAAGRKIPRQTAEILWVGKITSTEAEDSTLTRKAATEHIGTRTANRHRWVGRESRDEREKHC